MGAAGRAYAERHLAEGSVVERFLDAIARQSGDCRRRVTGTAKSGLLIGEVTP
jgi:hypothetical protein